MTERQGKKLPGMLKNYLLVNPQSEAADQNVRQILDMIDDETKIKIYDIVKHYLRDKFQQQIEALQEQIEMMGE